MPAELLQRLSFRCRHQFSWPRQSPDGDCYQVCLRCGVRYAYDWNAMRRAAPLDPRIIKGTASTTTRGHRWHPRERRLKFEIPVTFRPEDSGEWLEGRTLNVSRSGLLLRAGQALEIGETVEFIVDMPTEITGYNGNKVLCRGKIARAARDKGSEGWLLAFAINEYEFLRENAVGF
jgi:hypothetical protein